MTEPKTHETLLIEHFVTSQVETVDGEKLVALTLNGHRYHFSMTKEFAREMIVGLTKALGEG